MAKKLLGVDFGTGACKATVIDINGEVCATASKELPSIYLKPGWSEQEPKSWIDAFIVTVKSCIKQLKEGSEDIIGIGFSASTHNAVLLDKNGEVIRNTIMWNDQRSAEESNRLKEENGDLIFSIGMQMPTATWTLPQLLWINKNEPENFKNIHKLMFTKDYVRSFVTGDFCTDVVDAQGSLLFDARNKKWSKELCSIIDIPVEVLPEITRSKAIVGYVSKKVSNLTGLKEGIPVIAGCSDTAAEDFGAGAVVEGQMIVKLATAGNVNMIFENPHPHKKAYTYPYAVENMWYMVTGTNASASSYRWLRDSLYLKEYEDCKKLGKDIYELMNEDALKVSVGSNGLIFHPYILGERCPYFNANARANFFGISVIHDKKYFARAVLEGVAYSLYDCLQVVKEFGGEGKEIRIIGGGAKSPLWSKIVCDVFGIPVIEPEKNDSSFGVALLAGVGVGAFENEIEAVKKCNSIKSIIEPDMENHKKYMEYFHIYKEIVKVSEPIWESLKKVTN